MKKQITLTCCDFCGATKDECPVLLAAPTQVSTALICGKCVGDCLAFILRTDPAAAAEILAKAGQAAQAGQGA